MNIRKTAPDKKVQLIDDPSERTGELKHVGGSRSDDWNNLLANQTIQALSRAHSDADTLNKQYAATVAALIGISPQDELEGMMAAQLIAIHNAAMECYRRAMIADLSFEWRRECLSQANKLSRSFATLLEALNRHRGKGQQKVTVEHVHVHAGGQAVVGTIEGPRAGGLKKSEEQAHAKQIAHAPQPPMRCPDAQRDTLPITGNGEQSLPDARRQGNRRAKG